MAEQDYAANAAKDAYDKLAGDLLRLDLELVHHKAVRVARKLGSNPRVVVAGGAGSGKTTLGIALASTLGVRFLSLDRYIPGGYHPDSKVYAQRLEKGLYELWQDLPTRGEGWVLEHVLACHPLLISMLRPTHAILLRSDEKVLARAAAARGMVGKSSDVELFQRARKTAEEAEKCFDEMNGWLINCGEPDLRIRDLTRSAH